jgi:hypothetical protein
VFQHFWHTNNQPYTHNGYSHAPPKNFPKQIGVWQMKIGCYGADEKTEEGDKAND